MMIYRLYLVDKNSGKSTGKKRDYVSDEHFKKYGIETYNRYKKYIETKPKLCILNEKNKWKEVDKETLNKLLRDE